MKIFALLACIAVVFSLGCGSSSLPGEQVDVRPLIEAGAYDEAENALTQALIRAPRDADVLYNLAVVQHLKGQTETALRTAQKAADRSPSDDAILLLISELQFRMGDAMPALATYNRISQEGRGQARAQYVQGILNLHRNDILQAEAAFRTAVQLDEDDWGSRAALAFVLIKQDRADEAAPILDSLPAVETLSPDVIRQLAECYLLQGNAQLAFDALSSLSADEMNDASLWTLLGRAQVSLLRFDQAEAFFQRALAAPNTTPWHRVQYAEMLFAAQREEEALSEAIRAEEDLVREQMTISDPQLYNLMATLYARRGQVILAHRYLIQSLELDRNQPQVARLIQQLRETPEQSEEPSEATASQP